jgi:hypothetical protein
MKGTEEHGSREGRIRGDPRAGSRAGLDQRCEVHDDGAVALHPAIGWAEVVKHEIVQLELVEIAIDARLDPGIEPGNPVVWRACVDGRSDASAEGLDKACLSAWSTSSLVLK